MDYYKILNINKNATNLEIKNAYFKMARNDHPNKNPNGLEKFILIQQAYKILLNPKSRKNYDEELEVDLEPKSFLHYCRNVRATVEKSTVEVSTVEISNTVEKSACCRNVHVHCRKVHCRNVHCRKVHCRNVHCRNVPLPEPNGSPVQADDQQTSADGYVRLRIEQVSAMENERKYSTKALISHFNWELIARKTFPMIPERIFKAAAEGRQNRLALPPPRRYERGQAYQPNMLRLIPHDGAVHRGIRRIASDDEEEDGLLPQSAAAKNEDEQQIDVKPEPFLSVLLTCAEQKTRQNGWKCMANVELRVSSAKKTRSWSIEDVNFSSSSGVHNEPVFNRTFMRIPWSELTSDFIGAPESGEDWLQICACLNITEQIGYGLLPMNDILIVNECKFSVNKAYLAAFSNFFRTMFFSPLANNSGMLGGDQQQGEHQITDATDNINAWKLMLKIAMPNGAQPNDELIVDVLHLADKYDLPNVTEICEQFLLEKSKLPAIQKLGLADQYKLTNLKKHSIQQIDPVNFCELLQESVNIYNELSGTMRKQLNMRMKSRVKRTRIVEASDDEDQVPGPSAPKCLRSRARALSRPPAPTFTCHGFLDRAIARGRAVQQQPAAAIPNQAPSPQPLPPPRQPTAQQN